MPWLPSIRAGWRKCWCSWVTKWRPGRCCWCRILLTWIFPSGSRRQQPGRREQMPGRLLLPTLPTTSRPAMISNWSRADMSAMSISIPSVPFPRTGWRRSSRSIWPARLPSRSWKIRWRAEMPLPSSPRPSRRKRQSKEPRPCGSSGRIWCSALPGLASSATARRRPGR